ncbi:hypothetical protein Vadar_006438 [Vaccinium darrowii]|uniref:Uncharacterized protein n=1 Tax=Vaccinium darrowii TaxID=229202 RepID=A0ACB7YUD5_9ERIC|nr:hypothetical protein Vadar_006438 [Vaccinium darrowii]
MDINFGSRPKTAAGKYTTYNYSDITWSSSFGEAIMLKDHVSTVSLNVISRMVLGKREFKIVDKLFLLNGVSNIADSIPWLDCLDLQGYIKRMKIVGKKFDRLLEHVLDEHNATKKEEGGNFVAEEEEGMVEVGERQKKNWKQKNLCPHREAKRNIANASFEKAMLELRQSYNVLL